MRYSRQIGAFKTGHTVNGAKVRGADLVGEADIASILSAQEAAGCSGAPFTATEFGNDGPVAREIIYAAACVADIDRQIVETACREEIKPVIAHANDRVPSHFERGKVYRNFAFKRTRLAHAIDPCRAGATTDRIFRPARRQGTGGPLPIDIVNGFRAVQNTLPAFNVAEFAIGPAGPAQDITQGTVVRIFGGADAAERIAQTGLDPDFRQP